MIPDTPPPGDRIGAAELSTLAGRLETTGEGGVGLFRHVGLEGILVRRSANLGAELHEMWNDVYVVRTGRASVLVGGVLVGAVESQSGEWRGGEIRDATRLAMEPDDTVVIPAGVPHSVEVEEGGAVTYLVIKTAASTLAPPMPQ